MLLLNFSLHLLLAPFSVDELLFRGKCQFTRTIQKPSYLTNTCPHKIYHIYQFIKFYHVVKCFNWSICQFTRTIQKPSYLTKGSHPLPKRMKFQKSSKQPFEWIMKIQWWQLFMKTSTTYNENLIMSTQEEKDDDIWYKIMMTNNNLNSGGARKGMFRQLPSGIISK